MTYVSKKEKVFDLAVDQDDSSSSVSISRTETRLKRFPSVSDRKAWSTEECQRYQHFYGLVNGSESSVSKTSSFKYIPFDVLLAILMAEKDAYIQELLDRQDSRSSSGGKANVLYKAEGFEDSDDDREALIRKDAEVVALKNKIAGLESELEDYRETLTKAMHKLENMDVIMSENHLLKEKIRYSEETIKCLEGKKEELEKEVEYFRKFYRMIPEKEFKRQEFESIHNCDCGDWNEVARLSSERDFLLKQIEELQKELERTKANGTETDILRNVAETNSGNLEEIAKENELYKRKLENMKCLEKHIEELKKQAQILNEKYKRESQKANDHLKQIKLDAKELSLLREERDRLQQRVTELISYESQYISLKGKLHQVEVIIDENEVLNKKLIQLDKLEMENEELKMTVDQLKSAEVQAVEDKEKIARLQRSILDQEEEIRKMLHQIEALSQGYTDKNEIHRLQNELDEKNSRLKKYEKQLADIPVLESEIDELKNKLQKCIDDFKTDEDVLRRLQEELEACRKRCHELEELVFMNSSPPISEDVEITEKIPTFKENRENTAEISVRDAEFRSVAPEHDDKNTQVAEDTLKKIQEVEEQNRVLKGEIETLRQKLSKIDLDELISQTDDLKYLLSSKEKEIQNLNVEINRLQNETIMHGKIQADLEQETEQLKERNWCLKKEIDLGQELLKQTKENLKVEKKAREFAISLAKYLEEKLEMERTAREAKEAILKMQKEEAVIVKQETYMHFCKEIDDLKGLNNLYRTLLNALKAENNVLLEVKDYFENTENKSLKSAVNKLRAELVLLKNLSKPELEDECQALRNQVKTLLSETDGFSEEIQLLKAALNQEKKEKNILEQDLRNLQAELSACIAAGSEVLGREISAKESLINNLREELFKMKKDFENSVQESQALKVANEKLQENYTGIESEQKDLKHEFNVLMSRVEELNKVIRAQGEKEAQILNDIQSCHETMKEQKEELNLSKEFSEVLKRRIKDLEEILKEKEEELESAKKMSAEAKNEKNKVYSEMEVLKLRLTEKSSVSEGQDLTNYEKDLEEKYALEEALRKIENELDELKVKFEECKKMEDEMTNLRNKRDALLRKMSDFESEIERLKKKLANFEDVKNELVQLKANKQMTSVELEVGELHRKIQEQEAQIDILKAENVNVREELKKAEALLETSEKLKRTIPQNSGPSTMEFYTPPTLPSPRSSDPIECIVEMISVDAHKKELKDLETTYETKLEQIKETNVEKLKKLTENFEKENECRIKDFHECINIIKSSYESDIRKLVERHKASIMRLQGLHEDEVQELNTHYETQMEAIQTQNENVINDLKTEAAEKGRQLREQHRREIRDLESRYEELLKEKENVFLAEKRKVEASLTQNTNEINEVHKQALDSLTQFYQNSIVQLEEKHGKEMRKCKKSNMKKIELMKNKYEALLVEERKKYEEQLEEMLLKLKKDEQRDGVECERDHKVRRNQGASSETRLEFVEVLQKIINEGLESLTFDEVILVHSKTCFMPRNVEEEETGAGEFSPKFGDACRHRELVTAEKEELLKRIFTLEHEIVIKQLETHEAIVNMETAEKYRIQELKNALFTVQQKNAELKRLLSNQSTLQMDLKIDRYMSDRQANLHENNVMEKVKELEREKVEKKRLEEELQKEKKNVKQLAATLESEKERFRCQRKRDAEYVKSIRRRLEEALSHGQMMEVQLEREVELRRKLETELHGSQKTFNFIRDLSSNLLQIEPKTIKDVRNHDQSETIKEARHNRSKSKHRNRSIAINNL